MISAFYALIVVVALGVDDILDELKTVMSNVIIRDPKTGRFKKQ